MMATARVMKASGMSSPISQRMRGRRNQCSSVIVRSIIHGCTPRHLLQVAVRAAGRGFPILAGAHRPVAGRRSGWLSRLRATPVPMLWLAAGLPGVLRRIGPVTTKRSNMSSVNGAVPTTIIVAGLALAGYALVMTARNRRMNVPLLAAVGVLEILLLVQVGIIVARLAGGERPAGLATLIGYLIAMPFIPVAAAFWGLMERSR